MLNTSLGRYVQQHIDAAIAATKGSPVNPVLVLAIGYLESGAGRSALAANYNNHFGIKGTGTAGSITLLTKEYVNGRYIDVPQPFRRYNTYQEGASDFVALLQNKRYARAWTSPNPLSQAHYIWQAGYATDPSYISKLKPIINAAEAMQQQTNYSFNPIALLVLTAGVFYLSGNGKN